MEVIDLKIGVIGVGQIGGVVARELAANGHEVRISNSRGADAVKEMGAKRKSELQPSYVP
jgi:predicted dinucleotide-binding enzyme